MGKIWHWYLTQLNHSECHLASWIGHQRCMLIRLHLASLWYQWLPLCQYAVDHVSHSWHQTGAGTDVYMCILNLLLLFIIMWASKDKGCMMPKEYKLSTGWNEFSKVLQLFPSSLDFSNYSHVISLWLYIATRVLSKFRISVTSAFCDRSVLRE